MPTAILIFLLAALFAAAWGDLRRRIIPNALVLAVLVLALGYRAALGGLQESALSLALLAPPAIALFALRLWGGGDAKLLIALGAAFAPRELPDFIVLSAAIGGAQGVVALIHARVRNLPQPTLPYGLALAAGGGLALLLHHGGSAL